MAKKKILAVMAKKQKQKQKKYALNSLTEFKVDEKIFLNRKLIAEVLVDALLTNDMATFQDILITHLRVVSKTKLAKKTGLGRRTIYDLMNEKKFDPRISTLGALLSGLAA